MSGLAKKIHWQTLRRCIAWLLLTVVMLMHVDIVSIMQAIGAEKSKNWDVEYYLTVGDDNDEGIPIPEDEGISTLQASTGDTVHFNMFLCDQGSPDYRRFDETFTITMPEWLYQQLTDYGSEPLALGETEAAECGYLLEEVIETTDGNATAGNATASDADPDTRKVKLCFVEELRKAEDPKDIEIEEQWITLSFEVPFDTIVTSKQKGNNCEISFTVATASASNLLHSPLKGGNDIFLMEWTLTVDGEPITEGESVTVPVNATVKFKYEVCVAAGKIPTVDDCNDFEYTITLPKAFYDRMITAGGEINWPKELFNEPIVPQEISTDPDNYKLVLTFSDITKERIGKGESFGGAEGYFEFTTEEKIDLIYEVNEDEDSTTITYQPAEEAKPSIKVTKAIHSIFDQTAYLGNAATTAVKPGDYVVYTVSLKLENGVAGESYRIPAGSIYESFHGGVYRYVDLTSPDTKATFTDILNAPGYSVLADQKKLIMDLFNKGTRTAWATAAGDIPEHVPNGNNPDYQIMTNTDSYTLNTDSKTLNLYICLQVTDEINDTAITAANLKNNVYFENEYANNPASGVGPDKSNFYYDAALRIYSSTIWRVSDQKTGAGIPIQIGAQYEYPGILSNKNGAVHPGDFVTFVVIPIRQGSAISYVKSVDVYLPLGFEPVTDASELPDDYEFYRTSDSSDTLYHKTDARHRYFSAKEKETLVFRDSDFKYNNGLYTVRRYTFTWENALAEMEPRFYITCRVKELDPILSDIGMDSDDPEDNEAGQRYCYLVCAEISELLDEQRNPLGDDFDEDSWTDHNPFNDWYNQETGKLKNKRLYLNPNDVGEIDEKTSRHVRSRTGSYTDKVSPSRDEDDFDYALVWLYDDEEETKQGEVVLKEIVDTGAATTTQIEAMMAELAKLNPPLDIYTNYALPADGKVTRTQTIVPYCVTVNPEGVMQNMKGVKLADTLPQSMEFLCTPSGDPVVAIYEVIESGGYRFPAVNDDGKPITYIHPDYCKSYQVKEPLKPDYVDNSGIDCFKPGGIVDGKWNIRVDADENKLTIDFGDIEDNCYQVFYFAIVNKVSNSYENGAVLTWNGGAKESVNAVISYSAQDAVSRWYGKAVSLDGVNYGLTAQLPADSEEVTLYYRLLIRMTTSSGTFSYEVGDLYFEDHISELLGSGSEISVDSITFGDEDGTLNDQTLFKAEFDERGQKLIITNKADINNSFEEYIFFQVTYKGIRYGDVIRNTFGRTTIVKTPLKLDLQKIDGDNGGGLAGAEFELTYGDGTAVKDGSGAAITLITDKDGMNSVIFIPDPAKQGSDGTYTLYLKEVAAPAGYFELGGKDSKIMVEEYESGQYRLKAPETGQADDCEISTGSANEIQVTAKNYKYPTTAVSLDIELVKKLLAYVGREELPIENEYTFTVELARGDETAVTIPAKTVTNSTSDGEAAVIRFRGITISKVGYYIFKVTENVPASYPEGHNAGSYDPGTIYVGVEVLQEADGLATGKVNYYLKYLAAGKEAYYDQDDRIKNSTFINFLNPEDDPSLASVVMQVQKSLVGRTIAGNDFRFEAALVYSSPAVAIKKVTATNDADGKVIFPVLNFDQEGTYIFSISEQAGNTGDIVYDKSICYAKVIAERDRFGAMHCTLSYGSSYNETINEISGHIERPTFVNTVRGYLNIRKVSWSSGTSLAGAEFELLYRNKGSEDAWTGYGGTLVTAGSDGSLNLELPEAYWNYEYKLTETKAPSGYSNSRVGTILFTMLQSGTIDIWSSDGTAGYVELSADNITLIVKNHTTGGGGDGGGGGGGGTTPVTPTTPTSPGGPTTPTTPTTPATPELPPVTPGNNLVPNDDGSYYEVDDNGVALGRWYQDEDGKWIFDEMVPLADLAKTGEQSAQWLMLLMLLSGLGGAALVCERKKRKKLLRDGRDVS